MTKNYFKKIIDPKNKEIILICEISGNHNNSFNHLKKLINQVIKQRVDIVKFQVYKPNTLTLNSSSKNFLIKNKNKWSKYKNLFNLFTNSYTPWHWIEKCTKILNKNKINWFASAFDEKSVNFLESLNCKAFKIASPEITDVNLIEYIAKKNKLMILSSGMSEEKDLDLAVRIIKKYHSKIAILKCTSKYPATYKDLNLSTIRKIKKKYKHPVGFSDHTLDNLAGNMSVAFGATIIEKHFKLDRDLTSIDSHFSQPISNYKNLKDTLNKANLCIGSDELGLKIGKEQKNSRRSIYISKDIKRNEKINENNVKSIRPGYGLHPKFLKKIIGKTVNKNLKYGSPLLLKDINFYD
jgi:pseudaminic acid synthase